MSEEQKKFLLKIGINPGESLDIIEDKVSEYLVLNCFDGDYNPNDEGIMCESILDFIGDH